MKPASKRALRTTAANAAPVAAPVTSPAAGTAPAAIETSAPLVEDTAPDEEPRIYAVECLQNRTKIGKAIVAAGRVDFPLTKSEAVALQDAGLVKIVGTF